MINKQFYYKKHIKGYVNTWEVGEYWCYEKGKLAPFLITTKGYAEKVVGLLNEQQATIRRLQDLCGESDGENAKLRIENKKLKERNAHNFAKKMQLMKEIKELKAKLREKEEDERLYANEIVKLNKEAKEVLDFKSLGGDY